MIDPEDRQARNLDFAMWKNTFSGLWSSGNQAVLEWFAHDHTVLVPVLHHDGE